MATQRTDASVEEFLAQVPDDQRREDARRLCVIDRSVRIRNGIDRASR
jgi:hypothetical protein